MLINYAVPTLGHVVELIEWYRARWEIEIYFHVLKDGFEVEALQLSALDRGEGALAIVNDGGLVYHLPEVNGRTCPDLDSGAVLRLR
ncbi:transposase [Janthinobacterium svalbardensis]|uniref:transposase n=1 Tax=Janthinobacterium svalbardensis TaxID=368607 RepID=UPI002FCD8CFA